MKRKDEEEEGGGGGGGRGGGGGVGDQREGWEQRPILEGTREFEVAED